MIYQKNSKVDHPKAILSPSTTPTTRNWSWYNKGRSVCGCKEHLFWSSQGCESSACPQSLLRERQQSWHGGCSQDRCSVERHHGLWTHRLQIQNHSEKMTPLECEPVGRVKATGVWQCHSKGWKHQVWKRGCRPSEAALERLPSHAWDWAVMSPICLNPGLWKGRSEDDCGPCVHHWSPVGNETEKHRWMSWRPCRKGCVLDGKYYDWKVGVKQLIRKKWEGEQWPGLPRSPWIKGGDKDVDEDRLGNLRCWCPWGSWTRR